MVTVPRSALIVLAGLTALAARVDARPPPPPPDDHVEEEYVPDEPEESESPTFNMLGFDFSGGVIPIDGAASLTLSLGLGIEHPVFKKTRVFGEYNWMWIIQNELRADAMSAPTTVARPEQHASGHRASIGLRRELIAKGRRNIRMFIDGELGGSYALVNHNMSGVLTLPAGFVGVRLGYDLYTGREDSPSRTFETAVDIRAVAVPDGFGVTFGFGMFWGN